MVPKKDAEASSKSKKAAQASTPGPAASSSAGPVMPELPAQGPGGEDSSVNREHFLALRQAVDEILGHKMFKGISNAEPLQVGDGGTKACHCLHVRAQRTCRCDQTTWTLPLLSCLDPAR